VPTGKLEFWTETLDERFARIGRKARAEPRSEAAQRVGQPFVRSVAGARDIQSPFFDTSVWLRLVAIVSSAPGTARRSCAGLVATPGSTPGGRWPHTSNRGSRWAFSPAATSIRFRRGQTGGPGARRALRV
jgi:hypothetical protein